MELAVAPREGEAASQRVAAFSYAWLIVAIGVLVVTGALGFGRFGYTVILPDMKQALGLSETQAADLATGNMIGYLALSLAGGLLAARFGPRPVIAVSLAAVAAGMAATALASDYRTALAARIVTGMASGGANVPMMGLLSAWFDPRRRGLATGTVVSGSSIGLVVTGLSLPPLLAVSGGWRNAWLLLAGITAPVVILCAVLLRDRPAEMGKDGSSQTSRHGDGARRERVWNAILRTPAVWFLAFVYVLFGFSYIIYATFFVRFLTREAGFALGAAGGLWSLVGAASIASGFLWGWVSDRLGRKYGLAAVYFLQCISFAVLAEWRAEAGPYVSALLFALTAWSIPAIVAAAAGDLLGPRLAPAALGLLTLFFGAGQVAGPLAAGRIAEATGSYAAAFLAAAGAALLGAVLSLVMRSPKRAMQQS